MSMRMVCSGLLLLSTVSCASGRGSIVAVGGSDISIFVDNGVVPLDPPGGGVATGSCVYRWDYLKPLNVAELAEYINTDCLSGENCSVKADGTKLVNTCDSEVTIEIDWGNSSASKIKLPAGGTVNLAEVLGGHSLVPAEG